jgi:hypothetical protein
MVDPTRNRPKLARRRLVRVRPNEAAIDHDLSYDALPTEGIEVRRLR